MKYLFDKTVIVSVLSALLLVAAIAVATVRDAYASSDESKSGERLLVIHDGATEHGILTRAVTIREAFEKAGIAFSDKDLVEPGLDEKLVATSYDINIYRARPITVVDGSVRTKIMSAYRTPSQIVAHAGMELRSEDTVSMRLADPNYGASTELVIDRATPFSLVLYGKKTTSYTQATTVGGMLEEKGIKLASSDTLSVPEDTAIVSGMTVELWREGKQTVTLEEEIDFTTDEIRDVDHEIGFREVVTPGVKGKRTVTYEIDMKNGVEVGRVEIQSVVTAHPVVQVDRVGVKPKYLSYTGGGTKTEWLTSAGIPSQYWGYADALVSRESGWNPNAINPSSGACGLAQALPCEKVPGNPLDPVDSLTWMNGYVNGRYGGWEGAYSFWQRNKWY